MKKQNFCTAAVIALLTIFLACPLFAQERYVMPVDEASKDQSFLAFRTRLIAAVKRKDAKYVLSVIDSKVRSDFGESGSIAQFKKIWKNLVPASHFWPEFLTVISNGGTFLVEEKGRFTAPYTFSEFPEDLDGAEYAVIFGKNVNLRSAPKADARVVTMLSYNIVKIDHDASVAGPKEQDDYIWYKVNTLGGKEGYVKPDYIRSPMDYRAMFDKVKGKWKLTIFVAGD